MKNRAVKLTALVTALVLGVVSLTGCLEVNGERVAVVVGEDKYPVSEAQLYFYFEQYLTELNMAGLVTGLFGDYTTFWSFNTESYNAQQACLEDAMKLMVQTKVLNKEAEKRGVTLTAEEEELVTKATNKLMRERSELVNLSSASKEDMLKFMTENAIANKAYMAITEDMDTSVDLEEVQRKRMNGFTIMPKTVTDEDGNTVEQDPDEQKAMVQRYSSEILAQLEMDSDLDAIADAYAENTEVTVTAINGFSSEKPEEYDEGSYDTYEEFAWSLSEGEKADWVMLNANDLYVSYIFICVSDNDEEYTASATKTLLDERRSAYFTEVYAEVLKNYKKIHVYTDAISGFSVSETIYTTEAEAVTTY